MPNTRSSSISRIRPRLGPGSSERMSPPRQSTATPAVPDTPLFTGAHRIASRYRLTLCCYRQSLEGARGRCDAEAATSLVGAADLGGRGGDRRGDRGGGGRDDHLVPA